jgi:hypothetical protein
MNIFFSVAKFSIVSYFYFLATLYDARIILDGHGEDSFDPSLNFLLDSYYDFAFC